jgi:hypothetical protein
MMATTVKSRKAKGRALQNAVAEDIRYAFPVLDGTDVKVAIMGEQGVDIHLSPHARTLFGNWGIECKAQESLNIWGAMEQAETNAEKEKTKPLLFFKRNRTLTYVVMRSVDFFELIKRARNGN